MSGDHEAADTVGEDETRSGGVGGSRQAPGRSRPARARARSSGGRAEPEPAADPETPSVVIDLRREVLNAEEAAEFLRFSVPHLKLLAEAGDIPGWKIRSSWRFSRRALLAQLGWVETDQ